MKKLESYQLAALIERAEYQRFGETAIVCALILYSGFVVIGVSGCLNPADFDEQIGRDTAYKTPLINYGSCKATMLNPKQKRNKQ
ncbi:Gp49 family protein [Kingella negevensis]|uniref:Gp49 family protein n=1 Tax=Kingella negevensis TaxID=1522312 RepID=UPI00254F7BEC|nr:Gp49 family protein [Kingella negevensis]MDK4685403.1 Gp49 family protein [Kingella negevensis]MDK4708532.1 Gp49 family protein [Kingella negevensis]MDK4710303.1 Gp49 family protein [Kingella negevensis]